MVQRFIAKLHNMLLRWSLPRQSRNGASEEKSSSQFEKDEIKENEIKEGMEALKIESSNALQVNSQTIGKMDQTM
jgi:hypothetical protein